MAWCLKQYWLNLLTANDVMWHHKAWSALVQVMAWCLMAPSHYLGQCCFIISWIFPLWKADDLIDEHLGHQWSRWWLVALWFLPWIYNMLVTYSIWNGLLTYWVLNKWLMLHNNFKCIFLGEKIIFWSKCNWRILRIVKLTVSPH